jgi:hypothetical protein
MIRPVVIDERPVAIEPERRQRLPDVSGAVSGVGGAGVLNGVVDTFAGVLDIEDPMAKLAQAEQIHQRAPGDAAKRVARHDTGEQDVHDGKKILREG